MEDTPKAMRLQNSPDLLPRENGYIGPPVADGELSESSVSSPSSVDTNSRSQRIDIQVHRQITFFGQSISLDRGGTNFTKNLVNRRPSRKSSDARSTSSTGKFSRRFIRYRYSDNMSSPVKLARANVEPITRPRKESRSKRSKSLDERVTVGTKISEGHANYILMYDMLTGLRIAVSRCVAKPYRELEPSDFKDKHKLTFDIMGNELTPSSKYDFKFKDYSPWVFRYIRELFKIEAADYLVSLTGKYVLSELGSPGKSGSFFYFSQDYRFIIKTIHNTEHKFLQSILMQYYEYVKSNPNTLLCRYYGLHRVKLPHGKKIHFVVMGNVFPPNKDIHETFDLKGSLVGREVSPNELKTKPHSVLKDMNWIKLNRRLKLGPKKSKQFLQQLKSDVEFLSSLNIMDYSLLTGIHYLSRGNSENIRDRNLSIFEPNADAFATSPVGSETKTIASNIRKAIAESDPVQLGPSSSKLPETTPKERKGNIFYQDDGGFLSTNEEDIPLFELYYVGLIDILTPYNMTKRVEHLWKSLSHDKNLISAINPGKYAKRFLEFMTQKVLSSNHEN